MVINDTPEDLVWIDPTIWVTEMPRTKAYAVSSATFRRLAVTPENTTQTLNKVDRSAQSDLPRTTGQQTSRKLRMVTMRSLYCAIGVRRFKTINLRKQEQSRVSIPGNQTMSDSRKRVACRCAKKP